MKNLHKILVFIAFVGLAACTEDIFIDIDEGEPMVGVEASFTDELKHHKAILSYSAEFYNKDEIQMISGATVYVTDGVDTVYYLEDSDQPGYYFTDLAAGKKNTLYRLCIEVPGPDGSVQRLFSESLLPNNVERIDSLVIKPYNGANDTMPTVFFMDTIEWLYPYFQSLPDPNIIYMPLISINDSLLSDTLTQQMVIPVGGYAGYYINGPEMQEANKEIPIAYFRKSNLKDGDRIHAKMYSIPAEYLKFVYSLLASSGSNPMLGAPANVNTNIQPDDKGVGWFFTASAVSAETVFRE